MAGGRWWQRVLVGDARMVSEENLPALVAAGGRYMVGQSLREGRNAYEEWENDSRAGPGPIWFYECSPSR